MGFLGIVFSIDLIFIVFIPYCVRTATENVSDVRKRNLPPSSCLRKKDVLCFIYMRKGNSSKKAALQAQLREVELELKKLQEQFLEIKTRIKSSVSAARKRADARKISELRKQLGIEK
jgi:hypothetical protein